MRRILILLFIVCLTAWIITYAEAKPRKTSGLFRDKQDTVTLIFTNDMHAQDHPRVWEFNKMYLPIGGFEALSAYVKRVVDTEEDVLFLDAGDHFTGTPICTFTKGKAIIEIMNALGIDAAVLGNHEFDFGQKVLKQRIEEAGFDYLSANVYRDGKLFAPAAYAIYDVDGVKVGVIGITTDHLYELIVAEHYNGLNVRDPTETAKYYVELIESEVDLTILLTHQDLEADKKLARTVPYVDIIIGGHSGDALEQPIVIDNVLITRTYEKTESLGRIDALVDQDKNEIIDYTYQLIRTWVVDAKEPIPEVSEKIREYQGAMEAELNRKIGELVTPLTMEWDAVECNLGNFAADVPAEHFGVDIGLQNWGGLRKELNGPDILVRDIWEIFPFSNTWIIFQLTGEQVLRLFKRNCELQGEYLAVSKSVKYTFDSSKPRGQRLISTTVWDEPIEKGKIYTLVTCNYIFGHAKEVFGFPIEEIRSWHDTKILDRDLYIEYIKEHKVIDSKVEGRIVDVARE